MTSERAMSTELSLLHLTTARLDWLSPQGAAALRRWSDVAMTGQSGAPGCTISGDLHRLRWWMTGAPESVARFGAAFWQSSGAEGAAEDLMEWSAVAGGSSGGVWLEVAPHGVDSGWWVEGAVPLDQALEGESAEGSVSRWAASAGVNHAASIGWSVRGLGEGLELAIELPGDDAGQRLDEFEDLLVAVDAEERPPLQALARLEAGGASDASARILLDDSGVEEVAVSSGVAVSTEVLVGLLDDLGLPTAEHHAWVQGVLQVVSPTRISVGTELEVDYLVGDLEA